MPRDFIDLLVWQRAVALVQGVVKVSRSTRGPVASIAIDQMVRAAESVPANIAEGYGRGLGRDFTRYLRIAGASTAELESRLRVAVAIGRIPESDAAPLINQARALRAMLRSLAQSVASRSNS